MTPVQLEVLLACYYRREYQFERTPANVAAIAFWLQTKCIEPLERQLYGCTPRGEVLVQMLCDTPLPMSVTLWQDPRKEDQE